MAPADGRLMRRRLLGRFVVRCYPRLPGRRWWLQAAVRHEGGQAYSLSLRDVLRRHHSVDVGMYSYGSLLQPGRADRLTKIGNYVSIGPDVRRFGAAHPVSRPSMHPFWYNAAFGMVGREADVRRTPCVIESEVWIGAGAIILPGCQRIGLGAVVGAGSVVTRDVEPFTIVGGNPARPIGERLSATARRALLESTPWLHDPHTAGEILRAIEALDT